MAGYRLCTSLLYNLVSFCEVKMAQDNEFQIAEELKKLPDRPGVYIMHGQKDEIMYVGKAVNLKNRVRQYFQKSGNRGRGPQIAQMVTKISRFEYIVTDSELEALVLENNLIKEHKPKYNTMLTDDKTYPFIKVTVGEAYPRLLFTRQMKKDKAKYFGPYTSAAAVKEMIDLLRKIYRLRSCRRNLPKEIGAERPCLNYHIHQCDAPCQGYISQEAYRQQVDQALDFLGGNYAPLLKMLEKEMSDASERMDFEAAITWRDLLGSAKQIAQRQKITSDSDEDRDVLAYAQDGTDAIVQVFFVRGGRMIGRDHFWVKVGADEDGSMILSSFIKQYYSGTPFVPRELMLSDALPDQELVEKWLTGRRGGRVYLRVPQKGMKEKLVEMAAENAEIVLRQDRERIKREEGRTIGAMKEIADLLGLDRINRMEAFDISNISGFESVGSMVVFERGKPKKSDYRKFKIKTVIGPNDYASMEEVLTRRFTHGLEERSAAAGKNRTASIVNAKAGATGNGASSAGKGAESAAEITPEDVLLSSFSNFPDLLMMDGGRGQVNVAERVLDTLGLDIPVCGMVKDDFHRTRGLYFQNVELPIDTRSEGFKLITRIQDEAHRFAIEFHRSLRSKEQVHSVLDDIPGIGPARRKALMRSFESIEAVRDADVETLASSPSMNRASAEAVYAFFHPAQGT